MNGYSYRSIARTMIVLAQGMGFSLTALSLQKLIYFAHGLMLAKHGRPLVRETFQAWKYGPVLEPLYHDLKVFGPSSIDQNSLFVNNWDTLPSSAVDERNCISSVLKQLGTSTAGRLVDIAHEPKGPWAEVFDSKVAGIDISNNAIKIYFEKKLKKAA
jgi:uncharacterized phage-associated protein